MPLNAARAMVDMPLDAAADLQDNLLMVQNDLERLQTLLAEACDTLMGGFLTASRLLQPSGDISVTPIAVERAVEELASAVTALQFQDMATQLIAHTGQRLRYCTDRLASDVFASSDDEDDGDALVLAPPQRPNPVTQDEMDAGSVSLF